jgi:hypothetical protein
MLKYSSSTFAIFGFATSAADGTSAEEEAGETPAPDGTFDDEPAEAVAGSTDTLHPGRCD